jgi:hypothetical protein
MARVPRYIPPLKLKPVLQPAEAIAGEVPTFRLDAQEIQMWDLFAQEPVNAAGTRCELWRRNLAKSTSDPLYSEPSQVVFDGPYVFYANVEWPEATPEASEDGLRLLFPSGCWIPRKTLEDANAGGVRRGDVLRFWELPVFDDLSSNYQAIPGQGYFFDIIKTNDDGHLHDAPQFVAFRCDLKRKSTFGPEEMFLKGLPFSTSYTNDNTPNTEVSPAPVTPIKLYP